MALRNACIIGGGFYGVVIALYLKRVKRFEVVKVFEKEPILLSRASSSNQARVHNGYHYPRSITTAYRSHQNFHRFCLDWRTCIHDDFESYYAIARRNSKVTQSQFARFCGQIGAPLEIADKEIHKLFNPVLVEAVYRVEECSFDSSKLRDWSEKELTSSRIEFQMGTTVRSAKRTEGGSVEVTMRDGVGQIKSETFSAVFNCSYSGIGQVDQSIHNEEFRLKHEIAELALIDPPQELTEIGVTVMDGPFFSIVPFPARECHSLSHVRYTPHSNWLDSPGNSPYDVLDMTRLETRVDRMIRDATRYIPAIAKSQYRESIFEVKTVLRKNESDDGRPILFSESSETPGLYSVLGGKIDNIYDILEEIDFVI